MIIKGRRRRKKKRDAKNATEEIEGLVATLSTTHHDFNGSGTIA